MDKRNRWWVDQRDRLKTLYCHRCAICKQVDESDELQFAHIKETSCTGWGRGRNKRLGDITRNLDCYRLMHKDCHKNYDDYMHEPEAIG